MTYPSRTYRGRKDLALRKHRGLEPMVDKTVTLRRLDALAVMGWSAADVGRPYGHHQQSMSRVRHRAKKITREMEAEVAEFYSTHADRLHDTPWGKRTRTLALAAGLPGPAAWDDITDLEATPRGVRCAAS